MRHSAVCRCLRPCRGSWRVLAVRHRDAGRAQASALLDVLGALGSGGIEHVVLKGGVLARDIYPRPELRPLRDLDILVAPGAGQAAQSLLRELGFQPIAGPLHRGAHHHLPAVSRRQDGYLVAVEVHEDAMSYDQSERLTLRSISAPLRQVGLDGHALPAFGHVDMLRHLTAHLLQPRAETRLLGVVDLVGYAARYVDDIDWTLVRRLHPRVAVALALMDHVNALPRSLQFLRASAVRPPPRGVGLGFPPLSSVAFKRGRTAKVLSELVYPSEWWMRAYYGVPAERSLVAARWGRHVWRVGYWGIRRLANR